MQRASAGGRQHGTGCEREIHVVCVEYEVALGNGGR